MKIGVKVDLAKIKGQHSALLAKTRKAKSEEVLNRLKMATPVDTGAARDSWIATEKDGKIQISNDKEYISNLNAGSSNQAPAHFVEKAVLSVSNVKPNGIIVTYTE